MNILYILMRNDLESLNPGKAMAQAAHAANQFSFLCQIAPDSKRPKWVKETLNEWQVEGHGFGTTIVLQTDYTELKSLINALTVEHTREGDDIHGYTGDIVWGIVLDEGYPIKDGAIVHQIPLETCAYLFGDERSIAKMLVRNMELHP
jgi:hypothetical protein